MEMERGSTCQHIRRGLLPSRRTVLAAVIDIVVCHPVLDGLTGETIEFAQGAAGNAHSS